MFIVTLVTGEARAQTNLAHNLALVNSNTNNLNPGASVPGTMNVASPLTLVLII
ncbi:hypothetical protein GQ55_1G164800 [Panicum hallii var. hallii]|jgi:hypothetical protein|uniref:Uncharacterized protein n=1 Tax=Panicum hallii var. hallii TaxID=1504633 RepID=A0A2T7F5R3_9POAL|nr:hypothetical protein GQ55_1G164800 [Panicum hallii var. hallii]